MSRGVAARLSVVVVTYDSRVAIELLLPALGAQLRPGDEIVVVDNASRDGTVEALRRTAPDAVVVANARNEGFAAAANAGARAASGDLLLILNPDVEPAPGFVEAIRTPHEEWAAWMGLVRAGEQINSSGGVIHYTGIAWAGQSPAPVPREVAFLSGACLAIPRATFLDAGGFAAEYFMYHEDVELSLRLRLAGGRLGVEPAAVVDHDYTFAKGPDKWRLLERNRWATVLRTYPGPVLLAVVPALLATELALLVIAAAGGWLPQKLAANAHVLRALPRLWQERRAVQARRTVSAAAFAAWLEPGLDSPFLGRAARLAPVRWATALYWRVALGLLTSPPR